MLSVLSPVPQLDDSVVAKELTISDSEHSDAEVSYTENGMFNLSRGQTPLTEGSEGEGRRAALGAWNADQRRCDGLGESECLLSSRCSSSTSVSLAKARGYRLRAECPPPILGAFSRATAGPVPPGSGVGIRVVAPALGGGSFSLAEVSGLSSALPASEVGGQQTPQMAARGEEGVWSVRGGGTAWGGGGSALPHCPRCRASSVCFAFRALSPLADLDGHSDPEESFARDLPDFPSINPEATGIDDEDDTSIGIPSLAYRSQAMEDLHLPCEQGEPGALPSVQHLTDNIAGFVTRGMIQLALSGAPQPGSSRSDNPQRGAKTLLRAGSSDLDTDAEGDDFELLDQSELNQLDPAGSRGQ